MQKVKYTIFSMSFRRFKQILYIKKKKVIYKFIPIVSQFTIVVFITEFNSLGRS